MGVLPKVCEQPIAGREVEPLYDALRILFCKLGSRQYLANLVRYLPFVGAGVGNYSYGLLSYAGGQEQYLDGNAVTFVLEADGASPVPDIDRATQADFERFREDVTELLRGNVTLLFSTDPVVCADLAYPMDGSYTEQAVENILSDLDAQALWLYPADAKGA